MKKNLVITALIGILTVILGAFAAHSLKQRLHPDAIKSFETAIQYQMFHVLALLFVNMYQGFSKKTRNTISYFFFIGILFFSGSIYAIHLLNIPSKSVWFITPAGGIFFILGWVFMLISFLKKVQKN